MSLTCARDCAMPPTVPHRVLYPSRGPWRRSSRRFYRYPRRRTKGRAQVPLARAAASPGPRRVLSSWGRRACWPCPTLALPPDCSQARGFPFMLVASGETVRGWCGLPPPRTLPAIAPVQRVPRAGARAAGGAVWGQGCWLVAKFPSSSLSGRGAVTDGNKKTIQNPEGVVFLSSLGKRGHP